MEMDSRHSQKPHIVLLLISLLCFQLRVEGSGSVFFLDAPQKQFLRTHSSDEKSSSISVSDVGAAVLALLGFSPSASLSEDSSAKLNEILSPNPFNRPSVVVMLEVESIQDTNMFVGHLATATAEVGSGISSKLSPESTTADILLPEEEDEVFVTALDEPLGSECDAVCLAKELRDLASLLGGSYVSKSKEHLDGVFSVPLISGTLFNLDMSKIADRDFIVNVVSLVHNIKKAVELHEVLSRSMHTPPELMTCHFTGLKILQEKYGPNGVSQQGRELLLATLKKLFKSLQDAYQGQVVGVLFSTVKPDPESGSVLKVKPISRPFSRLLKEESEKEAASAIEKAAEVFLVRRILAWLTGIILLISTFIGIYFLLNMPITRDTLLYSNVKLD